MLLIDH